MNLPRLLADDRLNDPARVTFLRILVGYPDGCSFAQLVEECGGSKSKASRDRRMLLDTGWLFAWPDHKLRANDE